ncbi:MAG TPA: hypothetical protein DCF63_12055, partial [Planctomycetaceae bacterium]|nr:hypothetical protein [Planctomycetaceae bacterium]
MSFPVSAGTHTFTWRYSKDFIRSSGLDTAFIDNIVFPAVADQDIYSFSLAQGEMATIALEGLTGTAAAFQLRDAGNNVMALSTAGPTNVDQSLVNFKATTAGINTYYIVVTANSAYNLVVTRNASFDIEGNSSLAAAQAIEGVGALGHLIGGSVPLFDSQSSANSADQSNTATEDVDWYSIAVNEADSLVIQTRTPGDGSGEFVNKLNPMIELYNPSNVLVGSGVILGDGRNKQILHTATDSGFYRMRVAGEGNTLGEYFVSVAGNTGTAQPPFQVTASNPADGAMFLTSPIYRVDLNDTVLATSVQASDLKVNGINA